MRIVHIHSPLTGLHVVLIFTMASALWVSSDQVHSVIAVGYILFAIALYSSLLQLPGICSSTDLMSGLLILCGLGLSMLTPFILVLRSETRVLTAHTLMSLFQTQMNLGETIHPNVLAGALVLIIPLSLSVLLDRKEHGRRVFFFCLLATAMMSTAFLLTQSRGGVLGLSTAIVTLSSFRFRRFKIIAILGCVASISGLYLAGPQAAAEWLSKGESFQGIAGRLEIWQASLIAVADFPFTGIGIGTFTTVIPLLYPLSFPIESYPHAHNLFLQIGLDLGLPGLIAYLALLINLFVMLIITLRSAHSTPLQHTLAIGAAGSLVGMLVHGLLDAVTWGTKLSFLPWMLFALITQLFLTTQAAAQSQDSAQQTTTAASA